MTSGPSSPAGDRAERRAVLASLTREALRGLPGGVVTVSSATTSMAPFLRGGDRIRWRRGTAPRWGDVLLFLGRPGPVVHRVVGRRGGSLVTKGDNRPAPDVEAVGPGDVVGVVVAVERGGRRFVLSGGGPRLYALGASAISLAGGWCYRAASLVDAALRRLLPGARDARLLRPAAWLLQRGVMAAFHLLFFRPCHGPGVPVPEDEDR